MTCLSPRLATTTPGITLSAEQLSRDGASLAEGKPRPERNHDSAAGSRHRAQLARGAPQVASRGARRQDQDQVTYETDGQRHRAEKCQLKRNLSGADGGEPCTGLQRSTSRSARFSA